MVLLLADKSNFNIIVGAAAQSGPFQSGRELTKTHGFKKMAELCVKCPAPQLGLALWRTPASKVGNAII
jgi:hypothetical protein